MGLVTPGLVSPAFLSHALTLELISYPTRAHGSLAPVHQAGFPEGTARRLAAQGSSGQEVGVLFPSRLSSSQLSLPFRVSASPHHRAGTTSLDTKCPFNRN